MKTSTQTANSELIILLNLLVISFVVTGLKKAAMAQHFSQFLKIWISYVGGLYVGIARDKRPSEQPTASKVQWRHGIRNVWKRINMQLIYMQ